MRIILPLILLGLCGGTAWYFIKNPVENERRPPRTTLPSIEVMKVEMQSKRLFVNAFGTVRPRTMTTIIAEAAGRIEGVAPFASRENNRTGPPASFRAGGFFEKGDLLVTIEKINHQASEAEAEAALRLAELQLEQEKAFAAQARTEWELDRKWEDAPELVKRIPQIRKAEADTKAAQTRLAQARQILKRTEVRAPYRGRVLQTMADVGQQVGAGSSPILAKAYALEAAEIDLSLNEKELNILEFRDASKGSANLIEVIVMDGNRTQHTGILDRSEGTIDPRTRLIKVVARIDGAFADPFQKESVDSMTPLKPGQFVEIKLMGPEAQVFPIPSSALRNRNLILVLNEENRLFSRKVNIIKWTKEFAWVTKGLSEGEKVCLTPIEFLAEGMQAKPIKKVP